MRFTISLCLVVISGFIITFSGCSEGDSSTDDDSPFSDGDNATTDGDSSSNQCFPGFTWDQSSGMCLPDTDGDTSDGDVADGDNQVDGDAQPDGDATDGDLPVDGDDMDCPGCEGFAGDYCIESQSGPYCYLLSIESAIIERTPDTDCDYTVTVTANGEPPESEQVTGCDFVDRDIMGMCGLTVNSDGSITVECPEDCTLIFTQQACGCGDMSGVQEGAAWPMESYCQNRHGLSPQKGPDNPTLLWSKHISNGKFSGAAVDSEGNVFFSSSDGFYSLSSSGAERWQAGAGAASDPPAIGSDGTIYFSSNNGVYAFSHSGERKWKYDDGKSNGSALIDSNHIVYLSTGTGLKGFNSTGEVVWESEETGTVLGSPAMGSDGKIYYTTVDPHQFVAVDTDGSVLWKKSVDDYPWSGPTITHAGNILFGAADGVLRCYSPFGNLKWSKQIDATMQSYPAIGADGTIYTGGADLTALEPSTGSEYWSYSTNGLINGPILVDKDGTIIFAGSNAKINAVNANGTKKWEFDVDCQVSSISLGFDHTIYASATCVDWNNGGQMSGYFYAIGDR